jgi:hypothetical protein
VQTRTGRGLGGRPTVAIAVLVEYGGSGGKIAGPIVGQIAQLIHDEYPQYLDAGRPAAADARTVAYP